MVTSFMNEPEIKVEKCKSIPVPEGGSVFSWPGLVKAGPSALQVWGSGWFLTN